MGRLRLGKEGSSGVGQVQSKSGEAAEETTLSIGLCACVHVCMGVGGDKGRAGRAARKAIEG